MGSSEVKTNINLKVPFHRGMYPRLSIIKEYITAVQKNLNCYITVQSTKQKKSVACTNRISLKRYINAKS